MPGLLRKFFIIFLLALFCVGCARHINHLTYDQAMQRKLARFSARSRAQLLPYFRRARVPYPPKHLAILVFKRSRYIAVYARGNGPWKFIRRYPVLAASGGLGPKLHSGDYQVPEGIYHIVGLNPRSHYDLSLHLNYPNAYDRQQAQVEGRSNLGSDIFIHGEHSSIGCVAIGDKAIEQLFPLVHYVGTANTQVIIAPVDFRRYRRWHSRLKIAWVPQLYARIRQELIKFPLKHH